MAVRAVEFSCFVLLFCRFANILLNEERRKDQPFLEIDKLINDWLVHRVLSCQRTPLDGLVATLSPVFSASLEESDN